MRFEIDVPELASAKLVRQSDEVKNFLKQLHDFLRFLCKNFQAVRPSTYTFSAFLRKEPLAITNIRDNKSRYLFDTDTWTRTLNDSQQIPEEWRDDPDQPGNWMVLRLIYPTITATGQSVDKYVTLHSKDFEDGTASEIFSELLNSLMDFCHTVPELNPKLREAIRILQ
jgi:hypothetical protein